MADTHVTVRVPGLPPASIVGNNDLVPLWTNTDDVQRRISMSTLRTFILEGFSGSTPPVISGSTYILEVPASLDGQKTYPVASLAGKTFNLRRQGGGILPLDQFEILDAGGFKLTGADDYLVEGEIFEVTLFEYQSPSGISGGFGFKDTRIISVSSVLTADDIGKFLRIVGGNNSLTLTLPSLASVPAHSLLTFCSTITNNWQTTIQTVGGQVIYYQNSSSSVICMGRGESLWLYAGSDGWYVAYGEEYQGQVGMIFDGYKRSPNDLALDGTELQRHQWPRLWRFAQGLGASLVSESTWGIQSVVFNGRVMQYPYIGCFSTGDGSSTFRLPNVLNSFRRTLKGGATDPERLANVPGIYQDDMFRAHSHGVIAESTDQEGQGALVGGSDDNFIDANVQTTVVGGVETRPGNFGFNTYIRA